MSIPKQFEFEAYLFPQKLTKIQERNQEKNQEKNQEDAFSMQERQSLKNAFRYICRLIFKKAQCFPKILLQFAKDEKLENSKNKYGEEPPLYLFNSAQQISGERYFFKHVMDYTESQRSVICRFMLWFLQIKYLRYIFEQGKGKRQQMKKYLYVKFKNQVMIPYLQGILSNQKQ